MKLKGISRVDQPERNVAGWLVRVAYKRQRRRRYFGDRAHGGRMLALLAARDWRDQAERELGKPRSEGRVVARSRLGPDAIPGVRETIRRGRRVFEVTYQIAGVSRKTTVSIDRHGYDEARRRALQLRSERSGQAMDQNAQEMIT